MASAEGDAALAASASRRHGRRKLRWAAVLCFGSHGARGQEALASTSRARRKRTVPVARPPADYVARRGTDDDEETGKGSRARGCCCFLTRARVPAERQDSTMESSGGGSNILHRKRRQHKHTNRQQQASPQGNQNQPCQAPDARLQVHQTRVAPATTGAAAAEARARAPTRLPTTPRDAALKNKHSARGCCSAAGDGGHCTKAAGMGAFSYAVGLSVVAAVSMAGLLGGRLWALSCVCAWLLALSRLRQRRDA